MLQEAHVKGENGWESCETQIQAPPPPPPHLTPHPTPIPSFQIHFNRVKPRYKLPPLPELPFSERNMCCKYAGQKWEGGEGRELVSGFHTIEVNLKRWDWGGLGGGVGWGLVSGFHTIIIHFHPSHVLLEAFYPCKLYVSQEVYRSYIISGINCGATSMRRYYVDCDLRI